ncbi:hypothetical protein BCR37DRAFT_375502 [Protomyces lactucae-debilis]|uniref:RING-type domain-containing protein n=1 Tax=Protomyces lactucae-debilis TaxID=2754530 RepID=A0A1Y2FUG0_PROLT|nr:uncharacterized protein BCR37DRAFT_375502 [Protomyces lactucae-debilis]ORY87628.1 hypothetical protein BCR37DRAFT_375502 [Protomyces lactucae-debilis]
MEDERLADTWRQENAQQCPSCESWVQKASGCNHMSCSVCRCHFCFLCGESLPVKNPYLHYGKGMACAGRLFEGLTGLEDPFAEGPFA